MLLIFRTKNVDSASRAAPPALRSLSVSRIGVCLAVPLSIARRLGPCTTSPWRNWHNSLASFLAIRPIPCQKKTVDICNCTARAQMIRKIVANCDRTVTKIDRQDFMFELELYFLFSVKFYSASPRFSFFSLSTWRCHKKTHRVVQRHKNVSFYWVVSNVSNRRTEHEKEETFKSSRLWNGRRFTWCHARSGWNLWEDNALSTLQIPCEFKSQRWHWNLFLRIICGERTQDLVIFNLESLTKLKKCAFTMQSRGVSHLVSFFQCEVQCRLKNEINFARSSWICK